jgi:hypothetical protein
VDHLNVVGRLTPSMKWKPRIHNARSLVSAGQLVTRRGVVAIAT